ncbi:MAG: hypothetical protein H7A23_02365 [Leptospiraceae bacterium]|nr:hypothetical protein [Leptospiraceae bacterium]MCP5493375.1 hypothetical protein [Leptospiraceae bacterium]
MTEKIYDFILILKAEFKRDLIFMRRYPLEIISFLFFMYLILMSIILGFSQLMTEGSIVEGNSPLNREKMIIGYCLMQFMLSTQMGWSGQIQNESQTGTLEQLSISGHSLGDVLLARGLSQLPRQCLSFFLLLFTYSITLSNAQITFQNSLQGIFVLTVIAFGIYGISFAFAGLTLLFKRVGFFFQIINFGFLGLFWQNRASLEDGSLIANLYDYFPLTHGMKFLLKYFQNNPNSIPFTGNLFLLIITSLLSTLIGIFLFYLMEKRARNLGLLSQY